MLEKPSCAWKDLRKPWLRKFPGAELDWNWAESKLLGNGTDGVVWKVRIGDRVFALKVVSIYPE